jgi:outer membrane lipoprotein-sorting protein
MRAFVLGTAILVTPVLVAQGQPDVADILTKVSDTYANAKEFRFTVNKTGEESGVMRIAVRKPDKFRFEADGRVVDGADRVQPRHHNQ